MLSRVGRVHLYPSQYKTFRFSSDFYRRFIQGFSKIAAPLTSMLKATGSSGLLVPKAFRAENDEIVGGGGRANEKVVDSSKSVKNLSKSRRLLKESKSFKDLNNLQRSSIWRNVYQSTDPPSIRYRKLELLLEF